MFLAILSGTLTALCLLLFHLWQAERAETKKLVKNTVASLRAESSLWTRAAELAKEARIAKAELKAMRDRVSKAIEDEGKQPCS